MKWSLGASTSLSLHNPVRLACVKHAASVHPEPGSNSHVYSPGSKTFWLSIRGMISHSSWCFVLLFWNSSLEFSGLHCCLFVKVLFRQSLGDYQRRRRDLNPRAAINDLLPFQGSPFSRLGTSPMLNSYSCIKLNSVVKTETEKVGFEPTAPFGVTGFQDRLLKPLGHLSTRLLD